MYTVILKQNFTQELVSLYVLDYDVITALA